MELNKAERKLNLETKIADTLAKYFHDPIDMPCPYCEAAKAVIPIINNVMVEWLIERRRKLKEKQTQHHQLKPRDIQGEINCSIKARAIQEIINYLKTY